MNVRKSVWMGVVVTAIALSHCDDEVVGPDGSPSDVVFPDSNVSFAAHVQPLFTQTCAIPGCHDDGQNQSQLRLTSYSSTVVEIPGIVVPGNPDNSVLVWRIEGTQGVRMPLNRNPLNSNQIRGIRKWIEEGASPN